MGVTNANQGQVHYYYCTAVISAVDIPYTPQATNVAVIIGTELEVLRGGLRHSAVRSERRVVAPGGVVFAAAAICQSFPLS